MSFKSAKTPKKLVTAFKAGNMFKQPTCSRILAKKPTYFINKPKIAVHTAINAKIRAKSNVFTKFRGFFTNQPYRLTSHNKPDFCGDMRFYSGVKNDHQKNKRNGISVGNKFIEIFDPKKQIIEIHVKSYNSKLIWDDINGKYQTYIPGDQFLDQDEPSILDTAKIHRYNLILIVILLIILSVVFVIIAVFNSIKKIIDYRY